MRDRFERFMRGRYGADEFARFLLVVAVVCIVVNLFLGNGVLSLIALALLVYDYYRMFSKDYTRRSEENRKYLEIRDKVTGFFGGSSRNDSRRSSGTGNASDFFARRSRQAQDRKENHIYRCPGCGQKIRVPRGKGKIVITCPKCRTEFTRKS